VPELEQVLNNLDAGQISDPVVTAPVHLMQVEGRREQVLTSASSASWRATCCARKSRRSLRHLGQEVRGRAYVEMREPPR
jgi:peptidyl-prolyl cis-trans isomerase SurA